MQYVISNPRSVLALQSIHTIAFVILAMGSVACSFGVRDTEDPEILNSKTLFLSTPDDPAHTATHVTVDGQARKLPILQDCSHLHPDVAGPVHGTGSRPASYPFIPECKAGPWNTFQYNPWRLTEVTGGKRYFVLKSQDFANQSSGYGVVACRCSDTNPDSDRQLRTRQFFQTLWIDHFRTTSSPVASTPWLSQKCALQYNIKQHFARAVAVIGNPSFLPSPSDMKPSMLDLTGPGVRLPMVDASGARKVVELLTLHHTYVPIDTNNDGLVDEKDANITAMIRTRRRHDDVGPCGSEGGAQRNITLPRKFGNGAQSSSYFDVIFIYHGRPAGGGLPAVPTIVVGSRERSGAIWVSRVVNNAADVVYALDSDTVGKDNFLHSSGYTLNASEAKNVGDMYDPDGSGPSPAVEVRHPVRHLPFVSQRWETGGAFWHIQALEDSEARSATNGSEQASDDSQ